MSTTKLLHPNQIGWLVSNNEGRAPSLFDNEEERNAKSAMLVQGWSEIYPVMGTEWTEENLKAYMKQLQDAYSKLLKRELPSEYPVNLPGQNSVKLSPEELLRDFEAEYTEGKGKKLKVPELEGVFGYQRGDAVAGTLTLRRKLGIKEPFLIPVVVKKFASQFERTTACILENTSKTTNSKLTSQHWPSVIRQTIALREACKRSAKAFKESEVTTLISGGPGSKKLIGTGQKAYYISVLDSNFPKLGIVARIMSEEKSTTDMLKGQEYGAALDRDKLRLLEKGTRKPLPEKTEAQTEEDVKAYVENPTASKGPQTKAATREDAVSWAKMTPNLVIKHIIDCIYSNKLNRLAVYEKAVEEMNGIAVKLNITINDDESGE